MTTAQADLGPCVLATRVNAAGYGVVFRDGREQRAHRLVWIEAHGPIPPGHEIRHRCDNPPCIRLEHLTLGTHAENMRDAVDRDRIAYGERNARTRLTDEQVREVRRRRRQGETTTSIAAAFGIHTSTVSRIASGEARPRVQ